MSSKHFSAKISYTGMTLGFIYPDVCEIDLTCSFPYAICIISVLRMTFSSDLNTEPAVISKFLTQSMLCLVSLYIFTRLIAHTCG